jgi:hypothetical protein
MPSSSRMPTESTLSMSRAYSMPEGDCSRIMVEPRAYSSNLDQPGLEDDAVSLSTQSVISVGSGRKKTLASVYRAQNKAPDLWKTSAVSEYVEGRHAIASLKDLCGSDAAIFIDGDALKHIKNLGEGAYAGKSALLQVQPLIFRPQATKFSSCSQKCVCKHKHVPTMQSSFCTRNRTRA